MLGISSNEHKATFYAPDSWLIKDFVRQHLHLNPKQVFEYLLNGEFWIDRNDKLMKMRGNPVPRDLCFFVVKDKDGFYPKYGFPAFQYLAMSKHYRDLSEDDVVCYITKELENLINFDDKAVSFNHVIGTAYRNGKDNISWHNDKPTDIRPNTPIISLSFGETRELCLGKPNKTDNKKTDCLHSISVEEGDLFVLGPKTNEKYRHTIVRAKRKIDDEQVGPRISLVFRDIKTMISPHELEKRAAKKRKLTE